MQSKHSINICKKVNVPARDEGSERIFAYTSRSFGEGSRILCYLQIWIKVEITGILSH